MKSSMKWIGTLLLSVMSLMIIAGVSDAAKSSASSTTSLYKIINGVRIVENQTFTSTLTIDGSGWDGAIIRNNIFRNQTGSGIYISNVYNLTIENNEFYGMKSFAIKLRSTQVRGTDNVIIQKNYFHDMPATSILSEEPNKNLQILNNYFRNVATDVNATTDQHAMYLKGPDVKVKGNTIDGVPDANGISIRTSGTVRGNLVKNVARDGIKYYSNSLEKGNGTLTIECNVVEMSAHGGIAFSAGDGVKIDRAIVRFNTLVNNQKAMWIYENLDSVDFQIYGNLVVEPSGDYFSFVKYPSVDLGNYTSKEDVGFVSFSNHDYRLTSTSPARDYVSNVPGIPPYDFLKGSMGTDPYNAGAYQS